MPCRSGCPTQDHDSWGACARAQVRFTPFWTQGSKAGNDWHSELDEYKAAREQGIQPKSTKRPDIRRAVAKSEALDRAVDATKEEV